MLFYKSKIASVFDMKGHLIKSFVERAGVKDKPYDIYDTKITGFLMRVHPSGKLVFYFAYRNAVKKNQRIKIGVYGPSKTVHQAREDAHVYSGQVASGVDIQVEKKRKQQQVIEDQQQILSLFIKEHYKPWVLANNKTGQDSIDKLNSSFPEYMGLPLKQISVSLIEKWRTKKLNNNIKPSTINRCVAVIRALLTKAVEWKVLEENPLKGLKQLKIDNNPINRYLSNGERYRLYVALLRRDKKLKQARERGNQHKKKRGYDLLPSLISCAYADRMTSLVMLSLKTGLRRGESFDLCWDDVDFVKERIVVRGGIAKSMNTRHIPLSPIALRVLKKWKVQAPLEKGRIFPADDGARLDNVRKSFASILESANIVTFRWHDMRHDFASQLVMGDVPLNTVRELCGHADMKTTLRYAHLASDHKVAAIARIG